VGHVLKSHCAGGGTWRRPVARAVVGLAVPDVAYL
jgi:hypothetical protein